MLNYQIKKIPEDFQVLETIHLNCLSFDQSNYHYYLVEKIGLTTFQAIKNIATYMEIPIPQIGYAGLKDEDAVTLQYISLPVYLCPEAVKKFNQANTETKVNFMHLKYFGGGKYPLKVAKLQGNSFRIKIRNLPINLASLIADTNEHLLFFINYYGSQRFGLPHQIKNTHLIGKAIQNKDYADAQREIAKQSNEIGQLAKSCTEDPIFFIQQLEDNLLAFYQSAYYSYLWNQKISRYLISEKLPYKTSILDYLEYHFLLNELDILNILVKYPVLDNRRIVKDGNKFKNIDYKRNTVIQTHIYVEEIAEDDLNPGKHSVTLSFHLPTGCYATIAIAQFMQKFLMLTQSHSSNKLRCLV